MPDQRRGQAVHDAVLDATLAALAQHGYGFSVDDVARAAGVHKTTVYRRWETKAVLVAAAVQRLADVQVAVPDTGDVVADLTTLAVQVARALRTPAGTQAIRAAVAAAADDPQLVEVAGAFLTSRYSVAADLIQAGQKSGALRAGADPVLLWQAMVNPLHMSAICGTPPSDDAARQLVALVIEGARDV
jgi:AcrR family transcriptional regulator